MMSPNQREENTQIQIRKNATQAAEKAKGNVLKYKPAFFSEDQKGQGLGGTPTKEESDKKCDYPRRT